VPLVLLLVWRLYSASRGRRRRGRGGRGGPLARPGHDSEFYLIERRLESEGRGRRPWEPASAWIDRIHAVELGRSWSSTTGIASTAGLDAPARAALRMSAETWLGEHPSRRHPLIRPSPVMLELRP